MSTERAGVILILEDEPGVARLQQLRLERAGYEVYWAATAAAARADLAHRDIDLLLLDYRLPDAPDGIHFYQEIKAGGRDIPVIMVTGQTDDHTIIAALRAGVRDYVSKSPEYLDYLPEAIARVIDQAQNARERRRAEEELRKANEKLAQTLTELRSTTQQLWQSAKLASVGELAASLAHELNNPLGIISLRLESVLGQLPPDDPRRPALVVIEGEIERMARLIRTLLQFSRQGGDQVSSVDVVAEARLAADLAEHHLRRRNVILGFDYPTPLPLVLADRQKIRQLFLNLFTNAVDAMPQGGKLTVRFTTMSDPAGCQHLVVEVIDTGAGIPPELLSRVMDPFFTTKEEGKGTGLGLAICRRIAHDHKGTIRLESEPGKGTTVRITFPLDQAASSTIHHYPADPAEG
jgi:signal transduction histidine kinase